MFLCVSAGDPGWILTAVAMVRTETRQKSGSRCRRSFSTVDGTRSMWPSSNCHAVQFRRLGGGMGGGASRPPAASGAPILGVEPNLLCSAFKYAIFCEHAERLIGLQWSMEHHLPLGIRFLPYQMLISWMPAADCLRVTTWGTVHSHHCFSRN